MTIADLIRQGCKLYPEQAARKGFSFDKDGAPQSACVRAAAHAAYAEETSATLSFDEQGVCNELYDSGHPLNVSLSTIKVSDEQAPETLVDRVPCSLLHAITELNDHIGWTREKIADWIERSGLDATVAETNRAQVEVEV